MAAPRPVDVQIAPRYGPSAAELAGRVQSADPVAQAQVNARIRAQAVAQQQYEAAQKERQAAAGKPQKAAGFAIVKAVPSADTVVLLGSGPAHLPAPEKQLILSGISAPRMARRKGAEDEVYSCCVRFVAVADDADVVLYRPLPGTLVSSSGKC